MVHTPARMVSPGMVPSPRIESGEKPTSTPKSPSGAPYAGHIRVTTRNPNPKVPFGVPVRGSYQATTRTPEQPSKENIVTTSKADFITTLNTMMDHLSRPRPGRRSAIGRPQSPTQVRLAGVRSEAKKGREQRGPGCGTSNGLHHRNILINFPPPNKTPPL